MAESPNPDAAAVEQMLQELERARAGHREAETVLDAVLQATSDDLHRKNRELTTLNAQLEARVEARTADLAHAMAQAERANAAKSEFLARMSHEIRTPMNGVLGMLDVLRGSGLRTDQKRQAETAYRSALSLLQIINDILDMSKLEAGKLDVETIDFDLHTALQQVTELWEQEAARKHLKIDLIIDAMVPRWVGGDPTRLTQILTNLISNALKFTERGTVVLEARPIQQPASFLGAEQSAVCFSVSDTGVGIAAEARATLFAPFTQADTSVSRRYGGTGLGLAICKQLVTLMGGEIEVASVPGVGSKFSFILEFTLAERPPATSVESTERREQGVDSVCRGSRVLVVDDSDTNREVAAAILQTWDCHVTFAADGQAALEEIQRDPPDLVLMDCHMPGVDGFQATTAIRAWERGGRLPGRLVIVGISASTAQEERDRCVASGMDDFLPKPVSINAMGGVLRKWLAPASIQAAAQEPHSPASGFDHAQLEEMRSMMGEGFASLTRRFESNAVGQVRELHAAVELMDTARVGQLAHKLRGAAVSLGARALADVCADLEAQARLGELSRASALLQQIALELAAAHRVLTNSVAPVRGKCDPST
jgi:signal transduction histidine kinase/DNA-binding NarL/FixJ family response regulator